MSKFPVPTSAPIFTNDEKLEAEIAALQPTVSVDAEPFATSYEKLSDHAFEILLYLLFKAGGHSAKDFQYDTVRLLPVGTDRGRDVVLLRDKQPTVVVQCKRHKEALTLPAALGEISRFIMAAMVAPELMPTRRLTYVFAAPEGLTSPARELIDETPRILKEKDELVRECARVTRQKYKGLHGLAEDAAVDYVVETLSSASLYCLAAVDLNAWLKEQPGVYSKIFSVRMVSDTAPVLKELSELRGEIRRNYPVALSAGVEAWYHASSSALNSVVTRGSQASGSAPIELKDVYAPRNLEEKVVQLLGQTHAGSEGLIVLVIAPGGFGKTSLLWNHHRNANTVPGEEALLINAALVASKVDKGLFEAGLVELTAYVAARVAAGMKITVCLDTFDVLAHHEDHKQAALRLVSALVTAGASVLLSSRPEEVTTVPLERLAAHTVRLYLGEYDDEEFGVAARRYCEAFYRSSGWTAQQIETQVTRLRSFVAGGQAVRAVCLNPLTLRMLFELYAPDQVPEEINAFQLYSEYWAKHVRADRRAAATTGPLGRDISFAVQGIAEAMLQQGTPMLSVAQCTEQQASGRFSDVDLAEAVNRNLVFYSSSGSLEFFHQAFFEHAAARFLADVERVTLVDCVKRLRASANDAFLLPVYEQLLLIHVRRHREEDVNAQLEVLLTDPHTAVMEAGLHAHMSAPSGYAAGQAFMVRTAARKGSHALKRFCRSLDSLPRTRVSEVVAIIEATWRGQGENSVELVARMFLWLARMDWAACRSLLQEHELVEAIYVRKAQGSVNAERLVISVLQQGVPDDAEWCFDKILNCALLQPHARLALEFVRSQVGGAPLAAAEQASRQLQDKLGENVVLASLCLAAIWDAHPTLAPADAKSLQLSESAHARLILRALALSSSQHTEALRLALVDRCRQLQTPGALHVLLHEFIVPLLTRGDTTKDAVWQSAYGICRELLASMSASPHGRIVASAVRDLYASGTTEPDFWASLSTISPASWLQVANFLPLFPIAVAERMPNALEAFEQVCAQPATYVASASNLRGGLPRFPGRARRFGEVMRLASALVDPQFLMTYFLKAELFGEWAELYPEVIANRVELERIARTSLSVSATHMRAAALSLLDFLARRNAIAAPGHLEVLDWMVNERQPEVRVAAFRLLVETTTAPALELTAKELLATVSKGTGRWLNQVVELLREVLKRPDSRLSAEMHQELLAFALRQGAVEPQVSIVGRLIDIAIQANDMKTAQDTSLTLLRSKTTRALSNSQKRWLCHRLDKPFLALYQGLDKADLLLHVAELKSLDYHLGRLVVVSLCKSERPDIEEFLNVIMGEHLVDSALKGVIQDYRKFLWRRTRADRT
ncbi:restriction endonuclease [Paraburkholderia caledonica]|uniref:restriction endonuclease n=1 Tax=Paraburkholderia caledonica TaxID=134536 RepID=UPI0038BB0B68